MKLDRKVEFAKQAIASITRDHDSSVEDVAAAVGAVHAFVEAELEALPAAREGYQKMRADEAARADELAGKAKAGGESQTIEAGDVATLPADLTGAAHGNA